MQYFAIVLVSALSLSLLSMYMFMIYTINRLTKVYHEKNKIVKIKEMKQETFRFLLEDKNIDGNFFQRHYSVINLIKDNYNCFLLYHFYNSPLTLVVCLLLIQVPMTILLCVCPPYRLPWNNRMSLVTQLLYCVLDIVFIWNIAGGKSISPTVRYYYIGFSLIVVVMAIILTNVGFGLYYNIKKMIEKRRKKQNSKKQAQLAITPTNDDNSQGSIIEAKNNSNQVEPQSKVSVSEFSELFPCNANGSEMSQVKKEKKEGEGEKEQEDKKEKDSIKKNGVKKNIMKIHPMKMGRPGEREAQLESENKMEEEEEVIAGIKNSEFMPRIPIGRVIGAKEPIILNKPQNKPASTNGIRPILRKNKFSITGLTDKDHQN